MNFTDRDEIARRMQRRKRRQRSDVFWNFLTICVVLATVALVGVFLMVYSNPYVSINPFPPPTMPVLVILPTSTATPASMPATYTPTIRVSSTPQIATVTPTLEPSVTIETDEIPTATPTTAATSDSIYSFVLQAAPSAVKSVTFKPDTGCSWQGVAGQIVDMQGRHLVNIGIELKGTYNGKTVSTQTISGTHTEYGDSGYEFQLGTTLLDSTGLLSLQLVDQAGLPLSDVVIFDTYATCDKNLVLINFRQVR